MGQSVGSSCKKGDEDVCGDQSCLDFTDDPSQPALPHTDFSVAYFGVTSPNEPSVGSGGLGDMSMAVTHDEYERPFEYSKWSNSNGVNLDGDAYDAPAHDASVRYALVTDGHEQEDNAKDAGYSRAATKASTTSARSKHNFRTLIHGTDISRRSTRVDHMGEPFPRRPLMCKLSQKAWDKLEFLFRDMDGYEKNAITQEDALSYFTGAFKNLSADAMFKEVDTDKSGVITAQEFVDFWLQVRNAGYTEVQILAEVDELLNGRTAWVDWKDDRNPELVPEVKFPQRPNFCKLSSKAWKKCQELFFSIDRARENVITRELAAQFFGNNNNDPYGSVERMFFMVDKHDHGRITPQAWMSFWLQARTTHYKDRDLISELDALLQGGPWIEQIE